MSWNITVYLEKKTKDSDKWEFVSCVHDNFKWLLHNQNYDALSDFDTIKIDELSDKLKEKYKSYTVSELDFFNGHVITGTELKIYAETDIEKSKMLKKALYIALGVPEYTDDEFEEIEDPNKYDSNGNIKKNWNPLTFPVNKELIEKVQLAEFNCIRAYKIIGMVEAAESMVHYDDELRFILIAG